MKYSQIKTKLSEAATLKASALRLMKDITTLLEDKELPDTFRSQLEGVRKELRRTWAELAKDANIVKQRESALGEVKKTVGGEDFPASDFLVVEDKESPNTWHLQVSKNGTPDHNLMGAAYAALTKGYRGNKYDGPDKQKALTKLKALYKAEEMDWPMGEVAECDDDMGYANPVMTPWGAKSFADLDAARAASEATEEVYERTNQLNQIISNIMSDPAETDKVSALRTAFDEYTTLIGDLTGTNLAAAELDAMQPEGAKLAESFGGASIVIGEAELSENVPSPRDPLRLDVRMITPGWGNAADKNYYSPDVLKRDAKVFEGVKMYTTDHKPGEKSERTEVSIIEKIKGFSSDGAPIAQVLVFDPDFAEKTRNRAKANMLETLECSILAYGKTKPGTAPDGRKGNIVEAITAAQSVDWVTKAGAGGRAERLAESAQGNGQGAIMDKTLILKMLEESGLPEPAQKRLEVREYKDESELKTVIESEVAYLKEATTPPQTEPVLLAEADVKATLAKTQLPAASQKRLAEAQYKDAAALDAAVKAEVAYLKEVTQSGKPLVPQSQAQNGDRPKTLAETNKTVDDLLTRRFGGVVAKAKGA